MWGVLFKQPNKVEQQEIFEGTRPRLGSRATRMRGRVRLIKYYNQFHSIWILRVNNLGEFPRFTIFSHDSSAKRLRSAGCGELRLPQLIYDFIIVLTFPSLLDKALTGEMRKAASASTFINRFHFQSPRIIDSVLLRQKEDKSSQNEEFMRLSYPAQFVISWDGSFLKAVAIIHWKSLTSRWAAELCEGKSWFLLTLELSSIQNWWLYVLSAVFFCSATDPRRKDCKRMMVGGVSVWRHLNSCKC